MSVCLTDKKEDVSDVGNEEEQNFPLVSAVIINYNNHGYIYECLKSVLMQDYPNIEVILSDDCSDTEMPVDNIIAFVNTHRKENIKRIVIRTNPQNLGTVRHLEEIRKITKGEFEIAIASDDAWYDEKVFSDFVALLEANGPEAEWAISQVEMRDISLSNVQSLFVESNVMEHVRGRDRRGLLNIEAYSCKLPGLGSAYRKSIFEKLGVLSDSYVYVEDYPMHVRALRMGILPCLLDRISAKHRGGGISKENVVFGKKKRIQYEVDILRVYQNEILPYRDDYAAKAYQTAENMVEYMTRRLQQKIEEIEKEERSAAEQIIEEKIEKESNVFVRLIAEYLEYRNNFPYIYINFVISCVFAVLYLLISNGVWNGFWRIASLSLLVFSGFQLMVGFVKGSSNIVYRFYKKAKGKVQ